MQRFGRKELWLVVVTALCMVALVVCGCFPRAAVPPVEVGPNA